MFGMGMTEILLIMGIILVVLGPEKIPDVARMIGKTMREVRKASNLLRDAVMIEDKPTPKKQRQPTFDQFDQEESEAIVEKTKKEIRLQTLPKRKFPVDIKEITIAFSETPKLKPRQVYLHVPYVETF